MKPVLVLRHTPHCPLGSVATFLVDAALDYQYINLFVEVPQRLPLEKASGLIVLAGPMSANETESYPFLEPELDWIKEAVNSHVPTLGICLGAQLLAKALGEKVYANPVKEVGWYQIEVLAAAGDDPLFVGCQPSETVFQWHGETFDLPSGAIHLAKSELCRNQAFRYGSCAYGLQFHVEMTPELMAQWFAEPELHSNIGKLSYFGPQVIRAEAPKRFPLMDALSQRLLRHFAALCREPPAYRN